MKAEEPPTTFSIADTRLAGSRSLRHRIIDGDTGDDMSVLSRDEIGILVGALFLWGLVWVSYPHTGRVGKTIHGWGLRIWADRRPSLQTSAADLCRMLRAARWISTASRRVPHLRASASTPDHTSLDLTSPRKLAYSLLARCLRKGLLSSLSMLHQTHPSDIFDGPPRHALLSRARPISFVILVVGVSVTSPSLQLRRPRPNLTVTSSAYSWIERSSPSLVSARHGNGRPRCDGA